MVATATPGQVALRRADDGGLVVVVSGRWRVVDGAFPEADVAAAIAARPPAQVVFDASALDGWDSGLVAFAADVEAAAHARGVPVDPSGLPAGVRRLLDLAAAAPVRAPAPAPHHAAIPERLGQAAIDRGRRWRDAVAFVGEVAAALGRLVTGRARARVHDVLVEIQQAGADAVPIVSLICFVVGLILAFVATVQLRAFGAELYIANLVGIAIVREMGAIMTAIVLAGRTGAAYAAQLGSMRLSEELDALRVIGVSPVDRLVLPRLIALTLLLPVLCLYGDLLGVLGGAVVGIGLADVPAPIYARQSLAAFDLGDLIGGLVKASVYGLLVAAAGCFEGLRAGRTAAAVGRAATAAVVDGIVLVIVACGLFAVIFYIRGW